MPPWRRTPKPERVGKENKASRLAKLMTIRNKMNTGTSLALTQGLCTLTLHKVLTKLVTDIPADSHLEAAESTARGKQTVDKEGNKKTTF